MAVTALGCNLDAPTDTGLQATKNGIYGRSGTQVDSWRVYNAGDPVSTWLPAGTPPLWISASFKEDPATVLMGYVDVTFTALLNSMVARGFRGTWTYYHEPEDDFYTSGQQALFRRAFSHLMDIWRMNPAWADIRPAVIFMAYTLDPTSGRNWLNWMPKDRFGNPHRDVVVGWDTYGTTQWLYTYQWVQAYPGRPWMMNEIGLDFVGTTDAANAAIIARTGTTSTSNVGLKTLMNCKPAPLAGQWWGNLSGAAGNPDYRFDSPAGPYPLSKAAWQALYP